MSGTRTETSSAPTEIGFLTYPGCTMAVVHGMTDLLDVGGQFSSRHGGPVLRLSQWALGPRGIVRTEHGHTGPEGQPAYLLVPGRLSPTPIETDEATPYAQWLRQMHARGTVLASVCAGAFILAETGLLSQRPATTHWIFADRFRERFPDVRLRPDRILVEDGDIVTAGGLMAWTDLGLRLLQHLLGPTVMAETAKFFLIDPAGREQQHYRPFVPHMSHGDGAVLRVQHWLQARAGRDVSVAGMAAEAGLEERTFLRRFKAATGLKPTEYAQHLRIDRARESLEFTRHGVDQIAWDAGYADPAAFRRVFHKIVGLSAGEYRQKFSALSRGVA